MKTFLLGAFIIARYGVEEQKRINTNEKWTRQ